MSAKTKIVVLHMKEIIYTGIFILLGILLIILLLIMFLPQKNAASENKTETSAAAGLYTAGIYNSSLTLNGSPINIEVVVDSNNINSIRLVNLEESVSVMYPLVEPSFDELVSQIYHTQSLEGISYSDENKYTSMVLLDAIETALEKARP